MLRLIRGGRWGEPRPRRAPVARPEVDEGARLEGEISPTPGVQEAIRLLALSRAELAAQITAELGAQIASDVASKPGEGPAHD